MTDVQGMTVLVTGASGYIGKPTVDALLARGCNVHVLGRTHPNIAGVTYHEVDLLDENDLQAQVERSGAHLLLHLAWSVTPGKFWTDLTNLDWVASSLRLFRAFTEAGGTRIVGVGSCAEYDWSASPLREASSPIQPATLYGEAKASTWRLLEALGRQETLSVAWARLFFLYGPGEPAGKLVADAARHLLSGKQFKTTPGLQKRDFIFVQDAAEALASLALSEVTGAVNIASGECIPTRTVLEQIESQTHSSGLIDFGARAMAVGEPLELCADIARLRDEVGYLPASSLEDGIAKTVRWWRDQGIAEKPS